MGICPLQRGHMTLHARNVAMSAGATPPELPLVVERLVAESAVRVDRAEAVLAELRGGTG
jgi:hydroxymethylglutaryl-CoA reductase